ncbi:conserved hypothetical protein [Coccidioides posadasii str. Silveira]|uniref:Uncharacterized protein n=1 Tax=Coccidioides posadasii (strain RMSCC 757 / Silveira) TaxID=443226 RepID=E9CTU1_COCPS|nr:conserved hypothetical protein [Coccidioides posadasii str. Silveira]
MVSTQRSQPPETREPGTPAKNLPEEQTQVHKETTNLDTSPLSTVDETSTANSERESTPTPKDKIQQLCEETKLLKKMVKWQEKLNALQNTQKHSRSESLDMATSNPTPAKRLLILRPPQQQQPKEGGGGGRKAEMSRKRGGEGTAHRQQLLASISLSANQTPREDKTKWPREAKAQPGVNSPACGLSANRAEC